MLAGLLSSSELREQANGLADINAESGIPNAATVAIASQNLTATRAPHSSMTRQRSRRVRQWATGAWCLTGTTRTWAVCSGTPTDTLRELFDGVDDDVRNRITVGSFLVLFPHLSEAP